MKMAEVVLIVSDSISHDFKIGTAGVEFIKAERVSALVIMLAKRSEYSSIGSNTDVSKNITGIVHASVKMMYDMEIGTVRIHHVQYAKIIGTALLGRAIYLAVKIDWLRFRIGTGKAVKLVMHVKTSTIFLHTVQCAFIVCATRRI